MASGLSHPLLLMMAPCQSSLKDIGYVQMLSCIPRAGGHSEDGLNLFLSYWSQLSLLVHCTEVGEITSERLSTQPARQEVRCQASLVTFYI